MIQRFIKILFLILISIYGNAQTHKYYFDATSGNDSYSSVQAQNSATPWASITKLNSFFTSLVPGDSVLFKSGDTFYGEIICSRSGSAGLPIVFSSYSTGAKPIITGLTSISGWTNTSGNLWQSNSAVTTSANMLNMVTVSGAFQPISRFPKLTASNGGWLSTSSYTWAGGSFPITGSVTGVLAGSTDYSDGQVVMRKQHWIIDKAPITSESYSGGNITLNFTQSASYFSNTPYSPQTGWGFFIQNSVNACTTSGEWAFNTSTKKLTIYSVGSPTGIAVSTVDTLIDMVGKSYLTFSGLSITGANICTALLYGACNTITFFNCDFDMCGAETIECDNAATNISITNCTFNHTNSRNIWGGHSTNLSVQYNTINNCEMVAGMNQGGDGDGFTISAQGNNDYVLYNSLSNNGYIGIVITGTNSLCKNNFVYNFCQIKDDGGAIYTSDQGSPGSSGTNKRIISNVVVNGGGVTTDYGTNGGSPSAYGIYLDGAASYCNVYGNSVGNIWGYGFHTNSGTYDTVTYNTFYNSRLSGMDLTEYSASHLISHFISKNNIMFARDSSLAADFQTNGTNPNTWGTFDSNYYCRPIFEPVGITHSGCFNTYNYNYCKYGGVIERYDLTVGSGTDYSLNTWQSTFGIDINSKKTPKTVTDTSQIKFYYNSTTANSTTSLGASYIDVYNTPYPGSVTLQSFSSVVLLYSLAAIALGASITQNNSILCNGGTTTLAGNGIGGVLPYTYLWSTGATTRNITASAGTYSLTVTDGAGTKANASLTVTQPLPISITLAYGEAPTNVSVLAIGGTPTYTYKIDAGSYQSSNIFSSVAAGNHTITVQDANACTQVINFTVISGGTPLTISNIVQDSTALCYGGTTSATVTATGGTAPYTYLWSNSQTTQTATNLSAITYTVTVTDAASHVADTFITITQPTIISIVQITYNIISTHGGTTTVYVNSTGGTGSLTYQLDASGYGSADSFTTVSAGNHTAYVKDSNGCIVSQGFTILQPAANILNYYLKPRNRHIKYIQL